MIEMVGVLRHIVEIELLFLPIDIVIRMKVIFQMLGERCIYRLLDSVFPNVL